MLQEDFGSPITQWLALASVDAHLRNPNRQPWEIVEEVVKKEKAEGEESEEEEEEEVVSSPAPGYRDYLFQPVKNEVRPEKEMRIALFLRMIYLIKLQPVVG